VVVGNWFWRRLVAHQRTSALSGFDWSLFDFIHAAGRFVYASGQSRGKRDYVSGPA